MTAESYVPTTDEVRAVWREWNGYGGLISRTGPEPTTRAGMVAEFDSWLDQVKAEARREGQAEAWNVGRTKGIWDTAHRGKWNDDGDLVVPPTPNPYEEDL